MNRHAFAALAILAAGTTYAQDLAPKIDHVPVTKASRSESLTLRARMISQSGKAIFEPTLYLRLAGFSGFTRVAMKADPMMQNVFEAQIPAEHVSGDFDYYLEAFDEDGNGPARVGSPEQPIHVAVVAPDVPKKTAEPTLQPQSAAQPQPQTIVVMAPPPQPEGRPLAPGLALWIIGGFSGLATAGCGVAFNLISSDVQARFNDPTRSAVRASDYNTGATFAAATNVGMVLTGLFLVSAITYTVWPSHGSHAQEATPAATTPATQPAAPPAKAPAKPPSAQGDEFD